jgi:hypothetical protein
LENKVIGYYDSQHYDVIGLGEFTSVYTAKWKNTTIHAIKKFISNKEARKDKYVYRNHHVITFL